MVLPALANPSGKRSPPTLTKPVWYHVINYERLISGASTTMLRTTSVIKKQTTELSDNNNGNSWSSDSDTDSDEITSSSSHSIKEKSSGSSGGLSLVMRAADEDEKVEDESELCLHIRSLFESFSKGIGKSEAGWTPEEGSSPSGDVGETLTESERKAQKAYFVVREMISSEKVFIDVLKLLTEDFVEFIKTALPGAENAILRDNDLYKIIDTLPQLKELNEMLLSDMEERLAGWSTYPKISDVIIEKGPFLKLFSAYIRDFEKQSNYLEELYQKNGRFAKALRDFEALDRLKRLTLKHYMLKPVQRLPQYKLLLEQYLNQLTPESIDYEDTQEALKIVCDVANLANRSVQHGQNSERLLKLQNRLGSYEIVKPWRELVKEGELYKYSRKATHLRYFILLNDALICTTYSHTGSTYHLTVHHESSLTGMKVLTSGFVDCNEFNIIATKPRSYKLKTRSLEELNEWVSTLEKTIKAHNEKQKSFGQKSIVLTSELGKQAPIWVPDDRATMCQVCTAQFTLIFRRHHCRACGKVVCGNCSRNRAPLQYKDFETDRVCEDCYKYLFEEYANSKEIIIKDIEEQLNMSVDEAESKYSDLCTMFKSGGKSFKKPFPMRLAVPPIIPNLPSGWLHLRRGRSWKKYWFVLKDHVLYVNNAPENTKALETIPILGYTIETFKETCCSYDNIDSKLVFQLSHPGQPPLVFYADSEKVVERWLSAFLNAVSIS